MKREHEYFPLNVLKRVHITKELAKNTLIMKATQAQAMGLSNEAIRKLMVSEENLAYLCNYALLEYSENKQVYRFDKLFTDVLATCKLDIPMTGSLFKHLPYDVFFVHLEEQRDGKDLFGIFFKEKTFNIIYIGVFGENASVHHTVFPMFLGNDERLQNIEEGLDKSFGTVKTHQEVKRILQAAVYLSAKNAVITENPKQKTIYRPPFDPKHPKNKYSEIRMWDCGVRFTKEQSKQIVADTKLVGPKTGRHQRPHWRHAHYQHYWAGKGRKDLILKWKEPYLAGGKGDLPVVVHKKEEL